jgi:hypothetical protein
VSERRARLVDCNPRWIISFDPRRVEPVDGASKWVEEVHPPSGIHFDCPEGHQGCSHAIPFTPSLDGGPAASWYTNGAIWQRTGDTFETLTLSPSIRREPTYASREAAIAAGALEQYLEPTHFCALHIFIRDGAIEFCGDSR